MHDAQEEESYSEAEEDEEDSDSDSESEDKAAQLFNYLDTKNEGRIAVERVIEALVAAGFNERFFHHVRRLADHSRAIYIYKKNKKHVSLNYVHA